MCSRCGCRKQRRRRPRHWCSSRDTWWHSSRSWRSRRRWRQWRCPSAASTCKLSPLKHVHFCPWTRWTSEIIWWPLSWRRTLRPLVIFTNYLKGGYTYGMGVVSLRLAGMLWLPLHICVFWLDLHRLWLPIIPTCTFTTSSVMVDCILCGRIFFPLLISTLS